MNAARPAPAVADPPLVSVVTATYNWSSVLRYAIDSVRGQSYPRWEMVVVGDACTDDSEEVVRSFGDPRVRWHNREVNSGSQSMPNNDGIALARGEFVAYLGHDDLWSPDHIQRLVATTRRSGADVAFSLCEIIGPPGTGLRGLAGTTPRGGYAGGHLPPSSVLHRRSMSEEIGGWRDYRETEAGPDVEFMERALARGMSFACSWALTAFKLPAVMRPGVYRQRPCGEQRELARRISAERGFRLREPVRIAMSWARHPRGALASHSPTVPAGAGKGALIREGRRIRGLE
ncbi:MAG TPA: glycosyltransferase [Solirubrobacterales bacterium]|nr:glycosyltransferase [Solirubrobacterales bacterium]